MTYQRPIKYASAVRKSRAQQRGYADRQAGAAYEDNPYKNPWDRSNWESGWYDAEIDITKGLAQNGPGERRPLRECHATR